MKNTDSAFYKKLISIALPISLQSLISSSLTLLDNLMVSSLGELSLASVGLATQTFSIQWMMIFGFCSGCATFYTQFWGVKDMKNIRKVIGLALCTCMAASLVFFIAGFFFPEKVLSLFSDSPEVIELGAQYLKVASVNFLLIAVTQPFATSLRATQQTRIPMYISIVAFASDAIFNYLLIFGKFGFPKMGVAGAAVATVIARAIELSLMLFTVFARKNIIAGPLREYFSFNKHFVKRIYANAAVTTANETLWGTAVVAQNAAYGHLGVTAYAAVQASLTVMDLFQMACFSVGDASLILIGEQLGRGNTDEAKNISKRMIRVCIAVSCVMASLLMLLNRPIIGLFTLTELGQSYARKLIIIRAAYLPLNLLNALFVTGIFRAGGDARFAAITEILLMWLYSVPAAFICSMVLKMEVYWVMIFVLLEGPVKLAILGRRYKTDKWRKNMIEGL